MNYSLKKQENEFKELIEAKKKHEEKFREMYKSAQGFLDSKKL